MIQSISNSRQNPGHHNSSCHSSNPQTAAGIIPKGKHIVSKWRCILNSSSQCHNLSLCLIIGMEPERFIKHCQQHHCRTIAAEHCHSQKSYNHISGHHHGNYHGSVYHAVVYQVHKKYFPPCTAKKTASDTGPENQCYRQNLDYQINNHRNSDTIKIRS